MKLLFFFVLLLSSLGCSDSSTASLQERVLSKQAVAYLESTAQNLQYDVERCGEHETNSESGNFLGSTSDMGWGYSIWLTCEEEEGVALMDDFFNHLQKWVDKRCQFALSFSLRLRSSQQGLVSRSV